MASSPETTEQKPDLVGARLQAGTSADIPQIYFNGFANGMTSGDVAMVLERNGHPVAVLNLSFTLAKTLSQKLGQMIAALEEQAGRPMLTTDDIEAFAAGTAKTTKETK